MTSDNEKKIVNTLGELNRVFFCLDGPLPEEKDDFRRAIHRAQDLVALQVARRANPEFWGID
jgi:hypothetical protein